MFGENKSGFRAMFVAGMLRKSLRDEAIVVGARNSARNELDPERTEHQKTCDTWGRESGPSAGNEHVIAAGINQRPVDSYHAVR